MWVDRIADASQGAVYDASCVEQLPVEYRDDRNGAGVSRCRTLICHDPATPLTRSASGAWQAHLFEQGNEML